jgi:thiamine kinase-like enzyme
MTTQPELPTFADFPATPEELSPQWLTKVLRVHGIEADVVALTSKRIGTGQIGQNHRYSIEYLSAPHNAPRTLVGKFVSPDPISRGTGLAMGIYAKEAMFYREFAPALERRMRVARAWVSEFDAAREATLILMEDLAPAEQGDQMEGCSVEAAQQAVAELAGLHSTFWEHEVLVDHPVFGNPRDPMRAMILQHMMNEHWPAFIERYRDRLSADMIELGTKLVSSLTNWVMQRTGPMTLSHNDYRADNLMIAPSGDSGPGWTAAVDWQTVSVGFGGGDLGYFLGASLLPDDRRAHQDRLIDLWHGLLVDHGVKGYDRSMAWDDYRNGQFAGFITAVVSSMITQRTDRGDEMFWAMAGRHLETALETDAGSLIPNP